MATEEEAREATDDQEVQVEAANDLQTQFDSKLSSIKEIKGEAHTMDSTEGILKIPEDQVLVEAPSETKIPPEHNLNGVASSLNGHVDKEEDISNEQAHEINQESQEQVETSPDGTSIHLINKSNEEEITDSLSQGESASEDTTILKCENAEAKDHDQQDFEGGNMMQKENTTIDNTVEKTVDAQNLDSSKETKDTQPAITTNIPDDEVLVEAPAGIQSPLETNVDDSDAIPDAIDGNNDTDEPAKEDISYIDHKESFPEDKVIAEHENEEVKVEDQQSKQADDIDAEVLQEEIPESKEPDLLKTEQANEASIDDQEALNQEPALETNDTLSVKAKETCDQSNVATCGERTPEVDATTREPTVDTKEEQNQGSVEEMTDAEAVDTEEIVQQSTVALDEAIQDHAATTDPSSGIQHIQNIEPEETKGPSAVEAEEVSSQNNVAFAEDAVKDKVIPSEPPEDIQPVQELEQEEAKKADEANNETNPATFSNLNQEDGIVASEPHVTELAEEAALFSNLDQEGAIADSEPHVTELEEAKETEATETEEIAHQSPAAISTELPIEHNSTASEPHNDDIQHSLEQDSIGVEDTEAADIQGTFHERTIATSKEDIAEDNGTVEGPTSVSPEVQDVESVEEIKDSKADDVVEASNVTTVDEADQENTVLTSENITEQQLQGLESEEINSPEPVETEADLNKSHAAPFNDPAEELSTTDVESAEEIKDMKVDDVVEASNVTTVDDADQENNVLISENIAEQQLQGLESEEINSLEPVETKADLDKSHAAPLNDPYEEVITTDTESAEEIKDSKADNVMEEEYDVTTADDADQENNVLTSENIAEQQLQGLGSEEINSPKPVETEADFGKSHAAPSNDTAEEVNTTACETQNMESAVELKETEDTKTESIPQESNVELESVQDMKDTEATEPQLISQEDIVSTSEVSVPEENTTAKAPAFDDRKIQNDEPELTKEHDGVKAEEIPNQSSEAEEAAQDTNLLASDPINDVQVKELQPEEIRGTLDGESEESSHQMHDAAVEEIPNQNSGAILEETAQETNLLASDPTNDVQVKELQPEEIRNTEDGETEEGSHETHDAAVEDNWTRSEVEMSESSEQIRDTEPTVAEPTLRDSNVASVEEIETHEIAANEQNVGYQQLQEQESVEFKETEALEPQGIIPSHNVSSSEEFDPQETATKEEPSSDTQEEESSVIKDTEDVNKSAPLSEEAAPEEHILATEATVDTPPVQEPELEEIKNVESAEAEDNIATSDLPGEEMDTEAIETESIPHESTTTGVKELNEDLKSNVALAKEAASEEHILETEETVDKSSAQEPELEEIKNTEPAEQEHNITATGLPEEEMKDNEAMETETIPHDSNIESIKELSEDDIITASALDVDSQQVSGQECTDTTEHPGETPESILSTSDELTQTGEIATIMERTFDTQQVQNFTDQETKLSNFPTPEEAVQESDLPKSEPETDVQQEQELDLAEETKGTENYQQNIVSTFEESVTEVEPNVDDQHVQENEVKENEDTETEEIPKQVNFTTSENAAQESSEPVSDQPFYVQPVKQIELTKDSEDNQLVEAEETFSQSNIITPEVPTAEDKVANEIDPSVDIDQGHELELVEEIKDIDATEAEETTNTGQADSPVEQCSESNLSAAELTDGIQQVNELEATEEMKGNEDTGDEEICYQQTGTSEDPSPTDNGKSLQDYPVESTEENLGNGINEAISMQEKIEDNIHESALLKDETFELGEKTQISANRTEEDDGQISTEDTEETSDNINLVKEGSNEHGSGQISNVQDNEQLHDMVHQTEVCERSVDTIAIVQQDEAVKNVNLDQQQKEDEEIEKQKEELQIDEQKHDEKSTDSIIDTQVESIDAFEAEQTEPVVTEMLNDEVTQHISKDSIPRTADTIVENITEIKEETEEENGPNNDGTLEVSAKNYNEDVQENTEKDAVVAKTSSIEQDETTGEIRNEEVKPCLASSLERDLQADSNLSNDQMLEDNDEYRLHRAEEEYTNKVNVGMHAIQESDKAIEDVEEKQGVQNEDNVVCHDESLITTQKEEISQLHNDDQYSADTKMDDTTISYAEMSHENTSTQPREVEDTEEKKGFNAFPEIAETSEQNDVDQDFSIHHQVEDEKLAATENNGVEAEAVQPKLDMSIAESNNDNNISNPLPEHETENASDINQNRQYQEATDADAIDNIETGHVEKMETSYTATTDVVTLNEDICDKASGADEVPSDESLKTSEDTRRNLDVSSVVTESKGENINKEMEDQNLALPVNPTHDENTIEQGFVLGDTENESMSPEKALPAEPEEQEDNQVTKEEDEEDMNDPEHGDAQKEDHKEAEQDYLPVSSFLMNLILGKENGDPKRDSETEVEEKQEETTKDDSLIASQQEESLVSFPIENTVAEKLTFEQEKEKVEGSEETKELVKELVKEQSHDVELDVQKSLETDEEVTRNTRDLEEPVYQDNFHDEISSKLVSTKAADPIEKMEAREFELDEKSFDTVCQENVEAATETEEESLNRNQDDITSPKASQENASEEVGTELPHESLHDAKAEKTLSLIEPDIGNTAKLPNDADGVQSLPCTEQEGSIESSYVEVSTSEVQVESELVEKKEENQHTIAGGHTEEQVENPHDESKGTCSEAISDEQTPEITEPVSQTERNFAYEKEIPASSTCMDKEESNISNNEVSNFEKALEIPSDSPNLHVNQDKKDESSDNQIVMEHNTMLDKLEDSNLQEEQEIVAQKLPEETEGKQRFMATTELVIKEENVHETAEIKSNEEQELFDSQVQQRGLDAVSPKATSEADENFVEITKPEFSTDEEHSPKAYESKMPEENTCDEKTKAEEENNNITDEATVKIEERGAEQKVSHKKHNILSGVGSKVKHQLAKVKKAIIGKPGHTKTESLKS